VRKEKQNRGRSLFETKGSKRKPWVNFRGRGSIGQSFLRLSIRVLSCFLFIQNHQPQTNLHLLSLSLISSSMSTNHSTPLRRISHGSLSQSHQASTSSPTQLDFLAQPLADLVDEIDALHQNLLNINALSTSLGSFNEGFATFLYGMRMNAFSVEWPQVSSPPPPSSFSFPRLLGSIFRCFRAI